MPVLEISFTQGRAALAVAAKVSRGETFGNKTFYSTTGKSWLDWKADLRLHVQLLASGWVDESLAESFRFQGNAGIFQYDLCAARFEVVIPNYQDQIEWFASTRKAGFHCASGFDAFRIELWAFFHPPSRMVVRDIREWNCIAPSAGLPSLGKRR
jgi:hypothetical protein